MKTNNYEMELMLPLQHDKEVIFNEALSILDSFCNYTINDFIEEKPQEILSEEKYIIKEGKFKNYICFSAHLSKSVQMLVPKCGMIIFIRAEKNFFIFEKNEWIKIKFCTCE